MISMEKSFTLHTLRKIKGRMSDRAEIRTKPNLYFKKTHQRVLPEKDLNMKNRRGHTPTKVMTG